MRLAILSLALVVLVATVNGDTVLEKIKDKLTPSSHHEGEQPPPPSSVHEEHGVRHHERERGQESGGSVMGKLKEKLTPSSHHHEERLSPPPSSSSDPQRHGVRHHEQRGKEDSSFIPPSSKANVRERRMEKPEILKPDLPSTSQERPHEPSKMDDRKLEMQNPSDIHKDQQRVGNPSSSDQQASETFFFGRPYGYGYRRHYGYGYPYYRTYGYYPEYYSSYYY